MSRAPARIAKTRVCESGFCQTGHLLVRADRVEFVSVERVQEVGKHKLNPELMPSDVRLPVSYALVHDTTEQLLPTRCDLYAVRWHTQHTSNTGTVSGVADGSVNYASLIEDASLYFGDDEEPEQGRVDLPKGPWMKFALVQFIRYRRAGKHAGSYEHEFAEPVYLYGCKKPLAWRLALPNGCKVDGRGFVSP